MDDSTDTSSFSAARLWAHGGMWFLIWVGFGGCCYLNNHTGPLIIHSTAPVSSPSTP